MSFVQGPSSVHSRVGHLLTNYSLLFTQKSLSCFPLIPTSQCRSPARDIPTSSLPQVSPRSSFGPSLIPEPAAQHSTNCATLSANVKNAAINFRLLRLLLPPLAIMTKMTLSNWGLINTHDHQIGWMFCVVVYCRSPN